MIKLRVDDYPAAMPNEWFDQSKHSLLQRLEAEGVPYYLGIIPLLIDDEHADFLHSLKHARFAMHGFDHGFAKWRPVSEFDGMRLEDVCAKVGECLHRMYQLLNPKYQIDCFIPPFNHFNQILIDELCAHGFEVITGGPETYSQMDVSKIDFRKLRFVPSTGAFYTSYGHLKDILSMLPRVPDDQMVTLHLTGRYD